jgi:radical SAM superfamily enzyme YgiQ (UPF0313 family)
MNVLFVYPSYPDSFWTFEFSLKIIQRKAAYTPLGLLTVAAMVPGEWEKRFIDTNVKPLEDHDIRWADIVMISAVRLQRESTRELAGIIKKAGKKIIAGGPLFNHHHEDYPEIDHFVLGECELVFPELIEDIKNNCLKKYYTSEEKPDLSLVPPPAWELINLFDYGTMSVQYSRGCPFDCDFCDIVLMYGRKPRTKTPEQFLGELEKLYRLGWRGSVFVVDDNILCQKKKLKKLLAAVVQWQKKHHYPFNLITQASVDIAEDEELLSLMRDAFFTYVFIGFETTNIESLHECGKMHNTRYNYSEVVNILHAYGMQVMGGFIVGFDHDNEDIFQKQIDIIQDTGMPQAMVSILNAIPNTRLWERLKKENRLIENPTGENTDGTINFLPRMDINILKQGYRHVLETIYTRENYYKRMHDFLEVYTPHPQSTASFNVVKALFRTIWYVGVVSPSRKYFWKLVFKTMVKKAKALPEILNMAVAGEHFITFTKDSVAKVSIRGNGRYYRK